MSNMIRPKQFEPTEPMERRYGIYTISIHVSEDELPTVIEAISVANIQIAKIELSDL